MDITDARITAGGVLSVSYGPNGTGEVTGWTCTPGTSENLVQDETYTFRFTPQFSGTVLSESFTVSGVDFAGVRRYDTSVLRQDYGTDLRDYNPGIAVTKGSGTVIGSALTEGYMEITMTVDGWESDPTSEDWHTFGITVSADGEEQVFRWYVEEAEPDTGLTISSLTINVPSNIIASGVAYPTYSPSRAYVSLVYSGNNTDKAVIDPETGEIQVLQAGYVTFCVADTISGLEDCKQVFVSPVDNRVVVTYNVATAGTPTRICGEYSGGQCRFTKAELEDGTEIPLNGTGETTYAFPETGLTKIWFTMRDGWTLGSLASMNTSMAAYVVDVDIPDTVRYLAADAMYGDDGMSTAFTIPSSVLTVGEYALSFENDDPTVPDYLRDIVFSRTGTTTFSANSCSSNPLWETVTISTSRAVFSGENPFNACDSLRVFYGPMAQDNGRILVCGTTLISYTLGNGTADYRIPDNITSLYPYAFRRWYKATTLRSVTIPSSVTEIGGNCFLNLPLTAITFESVTPPTLGNSGLGDTGETFPIYVPCEALDTYKAAYVDYAHRITCKPSLTIVVPDTVMASGVAESVFAPASLAHTLKYSSSDTSIATIDPDTGEITVNSNGRVTFCVTDLVSGLQDCKQVRVYENTDDALPLTFEIIGGGDICWMGDSTYGNIYGQHTIQYRKNGGSWVSITSAEGSDAPTISVQAGDIVQFKGTNPTYYYQNAQGGNDQGIHSSFGSSTLDSSHKSRTTARFNVRGTIMSMVYGDNFIGKDSFEDTSVFYGLFYDVQYLLSAENLFLPASTLTDYCYYEMFSSCPNLVYPPVLSATSLAYACCYGMFSNCTSLVAAPVLSASRPAEVCYAHMFNGCTSLNYIKCLFTGAPGSNTLYHWTEGVSPAGTFVKTFGSQYPTGINGIPEGWTVQDAS